MSTGFAGFGKGPGSLMRSLGSQRERGSLRALVRLLPYLKPYKIRMIVAFICMLVATTLHLLAPFLIKQAIDGPIFSGNVQRLISITIFLGLVYVGIYVTSAWQRYLLSWVGQRVLTTLRSNLFRHLQKLSISYHDRNIVGVTISHVIGDVAVINEALSQGLISIIGDTLLLVGIIVAMITLAPQLALITFTVLPLMAIITWIFSIRARRAYRITRERVAQLVGNLAEAIAGMTVIQAFAQQRSALRRFSALNISNRDGHIAAASLTFVFVPGVELLSMAATGAILLFGSQAIIQGSLTLGIMVAFLTYMSRFFQPMQELSQLYATMQSAMAGAANVVELLDSKPDVEDRNSKIYSDSSLENSKINGKIEFRNVGFSYEPGVQVLENINLTIEAGQTVAFVGPTGAGKTTIANLIARFYDVNSGSVAVDNYDVRDLTQYNLRSQLALVPQDPFLFAGTVYENIAFGNPVVDESVVADIARIVGLDEYVSSMPEGYKSKVLEFGRNLSLGQRQLISVARAILVDPRIIILDEATSSIDSVTESMIQQALSKLLSGRTAIVIAHRLATIRDADIIFVINDGRLVEKGTHEELIALNGVYSNLNRRQTEGILDSE